MERAKHERGVAGPGTGMLVGLMGISALLGGGFALLFQDWFTGIGPARAAEEQEVGGLSVSSDGDLLRALRELASELRASREIHGSTPAAAVGSSERSMVAPSGESVLMELTLAVRQLQESLQASAEFAGVTQAGGRGAAAPLRLPRDGRRSYLAPLTPPPGTSDEDSEVDPADVYTREHLFWSEQQVLDRYGMPDRVSSEGDGELRWLYDDPAQDPTRSFGVGFFEGRVIHVGPL